MKVPQLFIPEKDLSKKLETFLQKPEKQYAYNPRTVEELISINKEFQEKPWVYSDDLYKECVGLVTGLKYTLKDIEELSKRIKPEQTRLLGIYLSVLINKIIAEKEKVILTPEQELDGIGMYLQKGTIIVEGNTNNNTGESMRGGKLIVKGNTNDHIGFCMEGGKLLVKGNTNNYVGLFMHGGELIVEGNTNDYAGYEMEGGKLIVKGKIARISGFFKKGVIIEEGTKIVRKA